MNEKLSKVCVYSLDKNAEQVLEATCELNGEEVACSGNSAFVENLNSHGVYHSELGKMVFPKDGAVFLEALPDHFDSGHLSAGPCE